MSTNDQPSAPKIKKYTIKCHGQSEKKLYLSSTEADIHFAFDANKPQLPLARIPAHKHLLAADSDEFKALFYDDSKKDDGDIHVTDVSDAVFKQFLQFFYLSEVELNGQHIVELMHLGHKYNVIKCVDVCVKYLKETATADSILMAMGVAILHNHLELTKFCEQFIMLNTEAVIKSSGFLSCGRQTLAHIIKGNLLACCDVKIFEVCMAWVKVKSEQNALTKKIVDIHLGDLFYEIRFGSMTHREFCDLADKYDAVLSNDFKTITKLITLPNFQPEKFNTAPRQIKWNDAAAIIECDRIQTDCDGCCGDSSSSECSCGDPDLQVSNLEFPDKTTFSSNEPLHLVSFTCVGIINDGYEASDDDDEEENDHSSSNWVLPVKVKITEMSDLYCATSKTVLMTINAKLRVDSTKISLPWPVLIKPALYYRISIGGAVPSWYDSKHLKDSVEMQPSIAIKFHDCPAAYNYSTAEQTTTGPITAMEFIKS